MTSQADRGQVPKDTVVFSSIQVSITPGVTLTEQSQKASIFEMWVFLKTLLEQEKIWLSFY